MQIDGTPIGHGHPVYIVAEMSCNHHQDIEEAFAIIRDAKDAGADAVKVQLYTPETTAVNKQLEDGPWAGTYLHDLYRKAMMPWEWYPDLDACARELGIALFSSFSDETAVDFLMDHDCPALKVPSFEIVDIPLLKHVAQAKRPVIFSTGMADFQEINAAYVTLQEWGADGVAVLYCNSGYPAAITESHLRNITHLSGFYRTAPIGLSDHSCSVIVPVVAVALGASIIETHITRGGIGPDVEFSMQPDLLAIMIDYVRQVEMIPKVPKYGPTRREEPQVGLRPSIWCVKDIAEDEPFTTENIKTLRPAGGLPCEDYPVILGKLPGRAYRAGEPIGED